MGRDVGSSLDWNATTVSAQRRERPTTRLSWQNFVVLTEDPAINRNFLARNKSIVWQRSHFGIGGVLCGHRKDDGNCGPGANPRTSGLFRRATFRLTPCRRNRVIR